MKKWLAVLLCSTAPIASLSAQDIRIVLDGNESKLESYPTELSTSRTVATLLTQINDYDFDYSVSIQGTVQPNNASDALANLILSGTAEAEKNGQASQKTNTCAAYLSRVQALDEHLRDDATLSPKMSGGKVSTVALGESQRHFRGQFRTDIKALDPMPVENLEPSCAQARAIFASNQKQLERLAKADESDHTVRGTVTLSPGYDYKLSISETYNGIPTDASPREFTFSPTNNAVTLSAGVALTWLQSRSYTATTVPDSSTSATGTKTVLVTGDTGTPRPVVLALLNYTIYQPPKAWPGDLEIGISAGPILQTGGKSDLATLGFFSGITFSFLHNLYITPGVHVGQYAGPPAGLVQGDTIPAGLGTLAPVKSYKPAFALGITFRTTSLGAKKVTAQNTSSSSK